MTLYTPSGLVDIVLYRFPDALDLHYERHSDEAWTVYVLDIDYSYSRWLACLSLDDRWTLSPRAVP